MWNWQGFHIPNILKKFQHVPVGSQACLPRYSKFVGTQQDSKDLAMTNKSGRSPTGFSCSSRDVALELMPQDKHNWQRKTSQIIFDFSTFKLGVIYPCMLSDPFRIHCNLALESDRALRISASS